MTVTCSKLFAAEPGFTVSMFQVGIFLFSFFPLFSFGLLDSLPIKSQFHIVQSANAVLSIFICSVSGGMAEAKMSPQKVADIQVIIQFQIIYWE